MTGADKIRYEIRLGPNVLAKVDKVKVTLYWGSRILLHQSKERGCPHRVRRLAHLNLPLLERVRDLLPKRGDKRMPEAAQEICVED